MATATQVLKNIDITQVTPEQIGKCRKAFEIIDGKAIPFYMVENEAGKLDDDGEIVEYKVTYSPKYGFQCTCKAGQEGFIHCKNGACKHIAWAIAASREESEAFATIAQVQKQAEEDKPLLFINGKLAHPLELERVMNAKPKKSHGNAKTYNPKPFSILR